ncbi:hypothetical protein ACPOL_5448 [Acidisarcina polymorpha]|uniref:Uncharacterized protein n=1 Tax=Acidisarcina polymorpha TaxID=2211140 RepID=A0A2Z5G7Z5_9BACT|nr:hypothetical protein ACPOL_5448 [Acidisarcina polymorpha]
MISRLPNLWSAGKADQFSIAAVRGDECSIVDAVIAVQC